MEYDELELDTLGDQKTALFVILSDTDSTFNFVAALMYSQLFNLLCDKADDFYGGRLPVHVRLILDEFANISQIPNIDKLIEAIADTAPGKKQKVKACIPYSAGSLVNELHENQKVISEEYGENGTVMELMVDAQMYDKIREYIL